MTRKGVVVALFHIPAQCFWEGLRKTTKTVERFVFRPKFELGMSRLQVEIVTACVSSLGRAVP